MLQDVNRLVFSSCAQMRCSFGPACYPFIHLFVVESIHLQLLLFLLSFVLRDVGFDVSSLVFTMQYKSLE